MNANFLPIKSHITVTCKLATTITDDSQAKVGKAVRALSQATSAAPGRAVAAALLLRPRLRRPQMPGRPMGRFQVQFCTDLSLTQGATRLGAGPRVGGICLVRIPFISTPRYRTHPQGRGRHPSIIKSIPGILFVLGVWTSRRLKTFPRPAKMTGKRTSC